MRSFYAWCLEKGLVAEDPTERIPPIRVPRGVPRPIQEADLAHALDRADPRMQAWLLLMALAALRCIEVSALRPEDLIPGRDGASSLFLRECKGGGTATMPAHLAIVAALAVLPIYKGRWWSCSRTTISHFTAAYLRSVGIDATAHRLRHYAGSSWYRASGHDLLTTSRLLRHASVATTQIFAALDETRPAEVVNLVSMGRPA